MANFKERICKLSRIIWKQYNSLQKCGCEECQKVPKKIQVKKAYTIPKVSEKRKIDNLKYSAQRIVFLGKKENQVCPITKWPATEVHHKWCGKDRAKYYLDESTWMAVSRDGHNWIHDNPKEARELGYLK